MAAYFCSDLTNNTIYKVQQGNRRSHFTLAVHSHHPLPGRSHLQWTWQWRNDPLCCMTLLVTGWSLLQRMHYNALSVGKKTPKIAPSPWDFVTLPEEDRAMAIDNMHRKLGKDCAWFRRYLHGQTDTQTDVLITILRHRCRVQSKLTHAFMGCVLCWAAYLVAVSEIAERFV